MTAQLRHSTYRESSYIDDQGHYCEIWSSDDDYDECQDSLLDWADFFEGVIDYGLDG